MASNIHTFNARDFRSNPIYRRQASLVEIQTELQKIERFYRRADRQYNYFTVGLIICIAVPLVLLFALPVLRELGWLMILGFVVAGIYMGSMRSQARQWHFPRERDRLFTNVLKLLQRDISPEEPFNVQLCLGQVNQTGKAVQKRPAPQALGQEIEDWRNPWFSIKGRFLDGNLFSLRLVERLTLTTAIEPGTPGVGDHSNKQAGANQAGVNRVAAHQVEFKQSIERTGSTQTGSTEGRPPHPKSAGFDVHLQLHINQGCYGDLTILGPHLSGAVKLLPGAELIHYYATEQDLSLTLGLPSAFTPSLMYQSIVMLLLSAYHILHLAAQLQESSPAPVEAVLVSGAPERQQYHQHWQNAKPNAGHNSYSHRNSNLHSNLSPNRNGAAQFRGGFDEA